MIRKLEIGDKHILTLIARDADSDGWAIVSEVLYQTLSKTIPPELVEFEKLADGGRARLTPDGQGVFAAMAWL